MRSSGLSLRGTVPRLPPEPLPQSRVRLDVRPTFLPPPVRKEVSRLRFGGAGESVAPASFLKQRWQWLRSQALRNIQYVYWLLESVSVNLRMAFSVVGSMFTFLPMPDRWRRYLEQNAFFSPTHSCNLRFLRDPALEARVSEHQFNMFSMLKADSKALQQAGMPLDPKRDNLRLNAWYIPAEGNRPTVLFHHGRASNISNLGKVLRMLSGKGYGILLYDYPGFGRSEGTPDETGVYHSGLAAVRYLEQHLGVPPSRQIMMGYSMGSAVASRVARMLCAMDEDISPNAKEKVQKNEKTASSALPKRNTPQALVLISTFPSIRDTFRYQRDHHAPWLGRIFKDYRIKLGFGTEENLKQLPPEMPLLILQGEKDWQTPIPMLRDMLKRLKRPVDTLETLKGSKHRLTEKDYQQVGAHFFNFMEQAFPRSKDLIPSENGISA